MGHKTADSFFFGYKTHIATRNERLITAATVTTGEKSDGRYLQDLIVKSEETGMVIDAIIEDTAYFGKENLQYAKENELQLVAKNSEITHRKRYETANSYGFFGLQIQVATAIFAVNLKRIISLLKEKE